MAIETSRNNRSVKISKNSSHKLSIHEQGSGNRVSPLGVPAVFHMVTLLHVCLCQPVFSVNLHCVYVDWPIGINNCLSTVGVSLS